MKKNILFFVAIVLVIGISFGLQGVNMERIEKRIDYIELPTIDLNVSKQFYGNVFGWTFVDYGPDYASFNDGRMDGGFSTELKVQIGGPLIIMYSLNLEQIREKILTEGGKITREIFEFPGGRRFHFTDPSGNELAIWSDK